MTLHITITSDFICPWCFIGERRLAKAMDTLPADTEIALQQDAACTGGTCSNG